MKISVTTDQGVLVEQTDVPDENAIDLTAYQWADLQLFIEDALRRGVGMVRRGEG